MDQTKLGEWMAGFFDGDGIVTAAVSESQKPAIGYHVLPQAKIGHTYVGGLFDAEGSLYVHVTERADSDVGAFPQPTAKVEMLENDPLIEKIEAYADSVGCGGNVYHVDRSDDDSRDDTFNWVATSFDDVERFLSGIRKDVVVKRTQIDIMLDEIIPLLRSGEHLHHRGFLKVMAWKDLMDTNKGGRRGKYNREYFEELWEMTLQEHELPKYEIPSPQEQGVS